jgi:hydrogenase-4 membrane subunit HyfE
MNINATLLGEIIFISVIVIVTSVLSYYLGKRKTNTPKMATFIGVLLAFIPPLGLIYIAILVLKNDINQNNTGEAAE